MKRSKLLAMMAMVMMGSSMPIPSDPEEITGERFNVLPKGCNHYRFNSMGKYTVNKPMDSKEYGICIYECFAINDKSAVKKFNKYLKGQ